MFFACGRVRSLHCTHFVRSGRDDILGVCLRTLLFRSESVGDPSTTADASAQDDTMKDSVSTMERTDNNIMHYPLLMAVPIVPFWAFSAGYFSKAVLFLFWKIM